MSMARVLVLNVRQDTGGITVITRVINIVDMSATKSLVRVRTALTTTCVKKDIVAWIAPIVVPVTVMEDVSATEHVRIVFQATMDIIVTSYVLEDVTKAAIVGVAIVLAFWRTGVLLECGG